MLFFNIIRSFLVYDLWILVLEESVGGSNQVLLGAVIFVMCMVHPRIFDLFFVCMRKLCGIS